MNKLRPDLPTMIPRIAKLPIDERGYPIPFFVVWVNEKNERVEPGTGKPEFRAMDAEKFKLCLRQRRCWVCGDPLGVYKAFVLGPMCTVNRITSEPPSHQDCAEWSVKGCPFLTKPQMVRREHGLSPEDLRNSAGVMIKQNPGVMAIWTTRSYQPQYVPGGKVGGITAGAGVLIKVGEPTAVTWWREGRPATVDEVLAAIDVGLPRLAAVCRDPEELAELHDAAGRMKAMVQGGIDASVSARG